MRKKDNSTIEIQLFVCWTICYDVFSFTEDTAMLQTRTKQFLLLARIREKCGHLSSSLATLEEARDNQYRLQKRVVIEQSSNFYEQNAILSK